MASSMTLTAQEEWNNLKQAGEQNVYLDKLMEMVGLEEVKREFLNIKAVVGGAKRHQRSLNQERQVIEHTTFLASHYLLKYSHPWFIAIDPVFLRTIILLGLLEYR